MKYLSLPNFYFNNKVKLYSKQLLPPCSVAGRAKIGPELPGPIQSCAGEPHPIPPVAAVDSVDRQHWRDPPSVVPGRCSARWE